MRKIVDLQLQDLRNRMAVSYTHLDVYKRQALIALGYSMVYGIILLLNFAHGDVIMVGAYLSLIHI